MDEVVIYRSIFLQWVFWLVNVLAFCIYAWDKRRAIYGQRRIPEMVLLLLALLGGATGSLCAMLLFRHKTNNLNFKITVPILFFIQMAIYGFLCWKGIL